MWILLVLSDGPDYGYNLIQRLDEMFAGYWKPKAGTIYPALEKLEELGLVTRTTEHKEEGIERRYYTIKESGEEVLKRGMDRWSRVMEHVELYGERHHAIRSYRAKESHIKVGEALIKLGESVKQGGFDLSEVIVDLEPEQATITDPVSFRFVYAYEGESLEIEMELSWKPEKKN
jgi:DNA-binding PadR family transcriptional regulator